MSKAYCEVKMEKRKKKKTINDCPNIMPGPRVEQTCRTEHVHTHDCQLWFPFKNKRFAACRLKLFADRHDARWNWQNWSVFPTTVHYQILIIWYFRVLHPNIPYWCRAEKYPEYPTWPPSYTMAQLCAMPCVSIMFSTNPSWHTQNKPKTAECQCHLWG